MIFFRLLLPFVFLAFLVGSSLSDTTKVTDKVGIANPASEYCIKMDGKLLIKKYKDGGEYGVCKLKDGSECEEWAFFRGQCPEKNKRFKDPFEYCKAIYTIDNPDKRFIGNKKSKVLIDAMTRQGMISPDAPISLQKNFTWRCMNGHVYVCNYGANIPCDEKADKEPTTSMKDYCKDNPQSDFIPAYVTERSTIYDWRCRDGNAVIDKEILKVDERGYIAEFWQVLKP